MTIDIKLGSWFLSALTLIFVTFKLLGKLSWSWFEVFIPVLIIPIIIIAFVLLWVVAILIVTLADHFWGNGRPRLRITRRPK